jgi:hypothetical protein
VQPPDDLLQPRRGFLIVPHKTKSRHSTRPRSEVRRYRMTTDSSAALMRILLKQEQFQSKHKCPLKAGEDSEAFG